MKKKNLLVILLPVFFFLLWETIKKKNHADLVLRDQCRLRAIELDSISLEMKFLKGVIEFNHKRSKDLADLIIQAKFMEIDQKCKQEAVASFEKKRVIDQVHSSLTLLD